MKTKSVIMAAVMAGTVCSAAAQEEKEKYYSESWKDNFFISVGVGVQGTTNPDTKFGKTISPLVNVSVGKLITPVWGVRGQVYGWSSKMETNYPFASVNGPVVERKENYVGVNLDAMVNLINLFGGYNPERAFDLNLFAGPSMNVVKNYSGWIPGYTEVATPLPGATQFETVLDPAKSKVGGHALRWLMGASVGLEAKYNFNPYWSLDLDVRGQVTPSILGAYSSGKTEGYLYMTLGTTYTFGGRKFVSTATDETEKQAINEAVNRYKEELARAEEQLAEAKSATNTEAQVITKEVLVPGPRSIFFKIGSAEIDDYGKVNLKQAAQIMKQNPDKKYKIAGYADKATGSKQLNQKLSEKRAQAVYDALVAEGVSEKQLELVGFGGTDNMFGKDKLNRVVILE